jgi:hypothetical protein
MTFDSLVAQMDLAIAVARASDPRGFGRIELAVAEQKMAAARAAARLPDYVEAHRRLAEAHIDLQLARLTAESARLQAELGRYTTTTRKAAPAKEARR